MYLYVCQQLIGVLRHFYRTAMLEIIDNPGTVLRKA